MKCIVVLTALLNIVGVNSYFFSTNESAYQRLDLHGKHSSFGAVVCVQDDVALVSAPYYSFNEFQDPDGILYVYRRDNGFWTLIRGITDLDYADAFGTSAAMHTDYFTVVGAPRDNKYGDRSGTAYYLYIEPNPYKTQMEVKQLIQSERHGDAAFGTSVAVGLVLNEVTVVVGAPGHRGIGAVFVYTRQRDGTLGNEEILYTSGYSPVAFGRGVQVGSNMVLGGAPGGKDGYVYIFQRGNGLSSGSFTETSVLIGISGYTDDNDDQVYQPYENLKQVEEFGAAIAVGDGFVFIGAPYAYSQTDRGNTYGAVTVFTYSTDSAGMNDEFQIHETKTPDHLEMEGVNSYFGHAISYSNSEQRLAIGSPYGVYPSTSLGAVTVYVFDSTNDVFEQEAVLTVDNYKPDANMGDMENYGETERAGFGSSVSIDGGYILVGAPQGASHYGDAYFFAANGVGSEGSTSFYDLITGNIFTSMGLFLFPIAIIGLVVLILLWRKFRDSNYDDSFGNFIIEEVGEFFGRVQSESLGAVDSCTSLQFMGDDDSAHSTHPMMVGSSAPAPKKKSKKSGKSSKFKSKSGIGAYESVTDNL